MRPILLDTNAYTAFKRGGSQILDLFQRAEILAMSPIVLGELFGGFEAGNQLQKNQMELQIFLSSPRVKIFSITCDTAVFYSRVYSSLRAKGKPIPTNDMWIAAQALEQGCFLCTYDSHFQVVDGLISGAVF